MKLLARIISVVFHPLLMTTYLFTILTFYFPMMMLPLRPSFAFLGLIALMTFILPLLNFLFFKTTGTIRNFNLPEREQRILPFFFISILYCVVTFLFYWKVAVPNVTKLLMIISALVVISAIITLTYKISVHAVAVWGISGIILPLNKVSQGSLLIPTVVLIIIAGSVMSSRLSLNAHTPREVMVGAMLGFGLAFTGMLVLF